MSSSMVFVWGCVISILIGLGLLLVVLIRLKKNKAEEKEEIEEETEYEWELDDVEIEIKDDTDKKKDSPKKVTVVSSFKKEDKNTELNPEEKDHTIKTFYTSEKTPYVWVCTNCETENFVSASKCCVCHKAR